MHACMPYASCAFRACCLCEHVTVPWLLHEAHCSAAAVAVVTDIDLESSLMQCLLPCQPGPPFKLVSTET